MICFGGMMMAIIETSTSERMRLARETFELIKPLLDDGYIYSRAVKKVKGLYPNYSLGDKAWFRDIIEYGESQGYSRAEYMGKRYGGRKKNK